MSYSERFQRFSEETLGLWNELFEDIEDIDDIDDIDDKAKVWTILWNRSPEDVQYDLDKVLSLEPYPEWYPQPQEYHNYSEARLPCSPPNVLEWFQAIVNAN